jgi:hypothetical protein
MSLIIHTDQIKKDKMRGECSMHGKDEKYIHIISKKMWGKETARPK